MYQHDILFYFEIGKCNTNNIIGTTVNIQMV